MTIGRIVVGIDGSAGSAVALSWAADLAKSLSAEVIAVHAVGLLEDRGDGRMVPGESMRAELAAKLEGPWSAPLRDAGVAFRTELVGGNSVTALLGVAENVGADLIVVGSRGVGGFSGLHLGSTSHQVALYAHTAVVIVPAEEEKAHE